MKKILDGKPVAKRILQRIKKRGESRTLGILKVGSDPGSSAYINGLKKTGATVNAEVSVIDFPAEVNKEKIINSIENIKERGEINGMLILEPLPEDISATELIEYAGPELDVEGIHPINMGNLLLGIPGIVPSTPGAVLEIIEHYKIRTEGKHAVIIGRSNVVGKPLALLLLRKERGRNSTVTVCHSRTENLKEITRDADLLISSAGKAEFVTEEFVSSKSIVIDVGINYLNGKITGDVEFHSVKNVCRAITPVPGGVGSVTTALLFSNLYRV